MRLLYCVITSSPRIFDLQKLLKPSNWVYFNLAPILVLEFNFPRIRLIGGFFGISALKCDYSLAAIAVCSTYSQSVSVEQFQSLLHKNTIGNANDETEREYFTASKSRSIA
jgi:hypothetical protein